MNGEGEQSLSKFDCSIRAYKVFKYVAVRVVGTWLFYLVFKVAEGYWGVVRYSPCPYPGQHTSFFMRDSSWLECTKDC